MQRHQKKHKVKVHFNESQIRLDCMFAFSTKGKSNQFLGPSGNVESFSVSMSYEDARRFADAVGKAGLANASPGYAVEWSAQPESRELPQKSWKKSVHCVFNKGTSELQITNKTNFVIDRVEIEVPYWFCAKGNRRHDAVRSSRRAVYVAPRGRCSIGIGRRDVGWCAEPIFFADCRLLKVYGAPSIEANPLQTAFSDSKGLKV